MIRLLFRFAGYWLLAGALVSAIVDAAKSIAASAVIAIPLGQNIQQLAPTLLQRLEFGVQNNLGMPWLWDTVFVPVMGLPSFVVLAAGGVMLLVIGKRRDRRVIAEDAV